MSDELKAVEARLAARESKADKKLEAQIRAKQAEAEKANPDTQDWDYDNTVVLQKSIDSGSIWGMEGHAGRTAMAALQSGQCFLPVNSHKDYYGNTVPCRTVLKPGTTGTLLNSARFWHVPVKAKAKAKAKAEAKAEAKT